jgi:hypothetical protein
MSALYFSTTSRVSSGKQAMMRQIAMRRADLAIDGPTKKFFRHRNPFPAVTLSEQNSPSISNPAIIAHLNG